MISNLSPDEAQLLKQFKSESDTAFATAKFVNLSKNHWQQVADLHFTLREDIKLAFPHNLIAYVSNLEGLGLVSVRRDLYVVPESVYEPLEAQLTAMYKDMVRPEEFSGFRCERGRLEVTHFGRLFIRSCVT